MSRSHIDTYEELLDNAGLCMYGHGLTRCGRKPHPGYKHGFRFCEKHLSAARNILPASAMPDGFTPDTGVDAYPFSSRRPLDVVQDVNKNVEKVERIRRMLRANPHTTTKSVMEACRATFHLVSTIRQEMVDAGELEPNKEKPGKLHPLVHRRIEQVLLVEWEKTNAALSRELGISDKAIARIRGILESQGRIPAKRNRKRAKKNAA